MGYVSGACTADSKNLNGACIADSKDSVVIFK